MNRNLLGTNLFLLFMAVKKHEKRRRHRRFIAVLFFILLFIVSSAHSQEEIIRFDRLSIEEGLAQSDVICILQDHKGFIWFGTEDGLDRYDGYHFDHFKFNPKDPNTISNSYILSIFEDKDGIIWIGTRFGGLNRLDPRLEKFNNYLYDPQNSNTISHNRINCILEDESGFLWLGTDAGLTRMEKNAAVFRRYNHDPDSAFTLSHDTINCLYQDLSGRIWIGTAEGLNLYDRPNDRFIRYVHDPTDPKSISDNTIHVLLEDSNKNFWVGTEQGLNIFDWEKATFTRIMNEPQNQKSLSHDHISSILEDRSKRLWIGTFGGGLNKLIPKDKDEESFSFIRYQNEPTDPHSLSNNRVLSLLEDHSGVFWVGTDIGLSLFDQGKAEFTLYQKKPNNPNSLSNNFVRPILEDSRGILWLGTYGSGLDKLDRETGIYTNYSHNPSDPNSLSNDLLRSLYEDKNGVLWVGTERGLNRFNRNRSNFTRYIHDPNDPNSLSHNLVYAMLEDGDGNFWVATQGGGLNKFDPATGRFQAKRFDPEDPESLSNDLVYCLYLDRFGDLWVGTLGGANRLDKKTDGFTRYQHEPGNPQSLSHDYIVSFAEDKDGNLWLGTLGGGLDMFDRKNDVFIRYTEYDALPNNSIYGILCDDTGNLWLSHNKGVTKFNPRNKTVKTYDVTDGLQSNEFNGGSYFKSSKGEMFFGGINGFNAFFPENIKDNPFIPPVVITEFQIMNKPVPIKSPDEHDTILTQSIMYTKELKLSHKDRIVSFEFAALHFASPEKNRYAYIMEGFDTEWNEVGNRRFVSYTNLPAGKKYTFRVKGSNNDGVWNEEDVSIDITIKPPFWQTNLFRGFIIFLVLALIVTIIQVRTYTFRKRSKQLEEKVEERTRELKSANGELQKEITQRKILEQQAQRRAAQSTMIYEVGQRVSSTLELKSLLSEIVNTIQLSFDYYGVMLLLSDGSDKKLNLQAIAGGYSKIFPPDLTINFGEGMIGKAASTGETQHTGDVSTNPDFVTISNEETKSELCLPIKSGKKIIGVLDIQSDEPNAFDKSDVEVMETLSTQIASAIENAHLYDQAQKEIEERKILENQLKDFAYIVSHDLKAPLRAVSQLANWISEDYAGKLGKEGKEQMHLLIGRVTRMDNLINGILQYSRATRLEGELKNIDLNSIVSEVLENLAPPDNISVKIVTPLHVVKAERIRMGQVFQNLISNAIKYMDKPQGEIKIGCEDLGTQYKFFISDNGPGIDPEFHDKIFQIFQTLESRDTRESTGVGLSVVKKIIDLFGGNIWLESEAGKGSTFFFTLNKP
ncbi:MAG: GAF domain-containing protein [Candidatus Aminicenantes bacterium]|nr:GAF domain-containing protein [Candidatus Aminicenantes bacterium]